MKKIFIMAGLLFASLLIADTASATNRSRSRIVSRERIVNRQPQKVRQVERVVVDNHHHNNVEQVIVVEKQVQPQKVRVIERQQIRYGY
jgi:NAD kinase